MSRGVCRAKLSGVEGPLQIRPRHWTADQFFGRDDEIPPVGPMDGARGDMGEVGDHHTESNLAFHLAHQVLEIRVGFFDYGGSTVSLVADQGIDLIAGEEVFGEHLAGTVLRVAPFRLSADELVPVLHHVVPKGLQVGEDAFRLLEPVLEDGDPVFDDAPGDLLVELRRLSVGLLLELVDPPLHVEELLSRLPDGFVYTLSHLLGKLDVRLLLQRLTTVSGDHHEPVDSLSDQDHLLAVLGLLSESLELLLGDPAPLLEEGGSGRDDIVALQSLGNRLLQVFDQTFQVSLEHRRTT